MTVPKGKGPRSGSPPAKGPETEVRPEDVLAARDSFVLTNYQGIGVNMTELAKSGALVKKALAELGEPRIFVNRSLRSALKLFQR